MKEKPCLWRTYCHLSSVLTRPGHTEMCLHRDPASIFPWHLSALSHWGPAFAIPRWPFCSLCLYGKFSFPWSFPFFPLLLKWLFGNSTSISLSRVKRWLSWRTLFFCHTSPCAQFSFIFKAQLLCHHLWLTLPGKPNSPSSTAHRVVCVHPRAVPFCISSLWLQ